MICIHMIAKEAQMASLVAINTFLKEFNSALILKTGVIGEIPKFCKTWRHLEQEVGPNWFPYARLHLTQKLPRWLRLPP